MGGHGFVGSAVVRAASRHGWTPTPAGKSELSGLKGKRWDLVINANGNSKKFLSDRDPNLDFDLSVQSVAHSLHDFPHDRYVFLSTVDVYPDKSNPANNHEDAVIEPGKLSRYGHHKWLAEELVRFNSPNSLIIRMAGFVGPGLKKNPIYDLLTGSPLRVHPDSAYQYQHTDDMADLLFSLIERKNDGGIYNIAGDGLITLRDVAAMIPGVVLPEPDVTMKIEHYEVNIEKIKSRSPVPLSRVAVETFVQAVQQGKVTLS